MDGGDTKGHEMNSSIRSMNQATLLAMPIVRERRMEILGEMDNAG